jgi:predicted 2-oxoglutarate/Fe(II)-dependent dioxygenase YbiX
MYCTFKCFTHEQVKEINKAIKNSIFKKEEPSENSANVSKIGKFSVVPCLPLMNLIHPWLYKCQEMNKRYFGYDAYWHFHLDSLNYNIYGTKGEYGWHMDLGEKGTYTDAKLTCLLNLSEEKYEGGEFNSMNQGEKIKFDSGEGLVINSLVAHKVAPVTKGERITLTYWAMGPLWR